MREGRPVMAKRQPADANWNPWHGCRKVSEACKNCTMFLNDGARIKNGFPIPEPSTVRRVQDWSKPYRLQQLGKPLLCSVCMSSDFFIEEADGWRPDVWKIIRETPSVTYLIQTKRPHRIADCLPSDWGDGYLNVWLGTSVEMKKYLHRLDDLRKIPCKLRYADSLGMLESMMPELADHLDGIGWCLASGEKGCCQVEPRPWNVTWAREIRDVCAARGIPFWFSHVAGKGQHPSALLDGREHHEILGETKSAAAKAGR